MLVTLKEILALAEQKGCAVGALTLFYAKAMLRPPLA